MIDYKAAYMAAAALAKRYRTLYYEVSKKRPQKMTPEIAREILKKTTSSRVIETALSWVNLTECEEEAIRLCCCKGVSQYRAAEKMGISRNSVKSYCDSALRKISAVWESEKWMIHLAD